MQCNINSRGRAVRLMTGLLVIVVGIVFAVLAACQWLGSPWGWIVAASCWAGGAFMVFEGWAGWCAVRALGFKTPL